MNFSDRPYEHASAWRGDAMSRSSEWIVRLDAQDNELLHRAVCDARSAGLGIPGLRRSDIDLGPLGAKLQAMQQEILQGRGFVLLRGFDIDRYTLEDAALAYWCIGAYLGQGAAQNAQGDVLGHVTNLGADFRADPNARGYQTRQSLPYHNDLMDIVGLLCIHPARVGGISRIVSSTAIHNEVLRQRPDLLRLAYEDFVMDRRGEAPEGKGPHYAIPLFARTGGHLFVRYNRTYVESAQRFPDVPRLSDAQIELLDLIDRLCNDEKMHLSMELARGDMQFISNHTTLHSRTDYEDGPDPSQRRLLLRLWLNTGFFQQFPAAYQDRLEDTVAWQKNPRPPIFDVSAVQVELAH
ncbi:TauD/TfdA family dioxygenase [Variovorax sp. dw_954]|uniref:TauD/TfdA family dioxygenase n=1 Tax=Variovorax sp. dw_954 TaxID=2720078 RepID=UPI001BD5C580|nr:TauD/TfdA family dioxygenase [Variovorax sp. dw_954]